MNTKQLEGEIMDIVSNSDDGGLVWFPGSHHGSSEVVYGEVVYVAQDPSSSLKHGVYRIRRGEDGYQVVL